MAMNKKVAIFWCVLTVLAVARVVGSLFIHALSIGDCTRQTVTGEGTIESEPERKESAQVAVIRATSLKNAAGKQCNADVLIRIKTRLFPEFSFGDQVTFAGTLSRPFNFSSDSGRSFDYEGYLAKDDIFFEIKSAKLSKTGHIDHLSGLLFGLKHRFESNLEQTLGEPHAALAAGLVVGEKAALGKDLLEDFRTVGLIHIVVLSGFNITVVGDAMRRLLSFLPRVWGIVVGAVGIVLFGILVGGGATVVRSCVMACIALFAEFIRRDYSVSRALALAALIMLIQNPSILLHDPSFQLSFLATLALILLASPIERHLTWVPEKFGMRGIVAATCATQIFVSPFILYMMGQLSIIGVVVNILVLPFIPVTMLAVFLTGAAGMISLAAAHILALSAHVLLSYELFMVQEFARIPFAAIHVPPFSGWFVGLFYAFFAAVKFFSMTSQFRLAKKSSRYVLRPDG